VDPEWWSKTSKHDSHIRASEAHIIVIFFCRLNKNEDVFDSSQDESFVTPLKKATRKKTRPAPYDAYELSDDVEARPPKPKGKPKAGPTAACKAAKKAKKAASTDESSTSSDSTDKDGAKKKKMPRITNEERSTVCVWIAKPRQDGSMLNGRWIRNGGAKHQSMTATSGQVKTSGAYDALAAYVNKKLRIPFPSDKYWTRAFSKKRWTSMYAVCLMFLLFLTPNRYKSFKEALLMGAKGNSLAGATAVEIHQNSTSLIVKQHKKCPCFDVFQNIFGETPGVKPVHPKEGGGMAPDEEDQSEDADDEDEPAPPQAVLAPAPPQAVLAPPPPQAVLAHSRAAAGPLPPPPIILSSLTNICHRRRRSQGSTCIGHSRAPSCCR
jgi:hypothetical protein